MPSSINCRRETFVHYRQWICPILYLGVNDILLIGKSIVQDASAVMSDYEEAVEDAEGEGWHREEVHSSDGFAVVAQKSEPAICPLRISWCPLHPSRDRSFRNVEAEHEKLTMNAGSTPGRVLRDHLKYEISHLLRESLPANSLAHSGDEIPIHAKSGSMPSDYGVGRDGD